MKRVRILKIAIENFKGVRHLKADFSDATKVCGDNATGKTTIVDAYTWCLFGKDSRGRTDSGRGSFAIKTLGGDGRPIEKLDHSVELTMYYDDAVHVIKKVLKEDWVTKHGETEAKMAGNSTHCYWDGAELKSGDYAKRVADMVGDIETFKILSQPGYFFGLPWEKQLGMVNQLIGNVTTEEVAAGNAERERVLKAMNGLEPEEYKKVLSKAVQGAKERIKANDERIAERRLLVGDYDTDALNERKEAIDAEIEAINKAETDAVAAANMKLANLRNLSDEVNRNRSQASDRLVSLKSQDSRRVSEQNAARTAKQNEHYDLTVKLNTYDTSALRAMRDNMLQYQGRAIGCDQSLQRLSDEWVAENGKEYQGREGEIVCPHTGKECDGEATKLELHNCEVRNREAFNAAKADRLKSIEAEAERLKAEREDLKAKAEEAKAKADAEEARIADQKAALQASIDRLAAELAAMPVAQPKTDAELMEDAEYKALTDKADALQAEYESKKADGLKEPELNKERRAFLHQQLKDINDSINSAKVSEESRQRIAELEEDSRQAAISKADAERDLDILDDIHRAKVEEMARRVKAHFERVTFKFYEQQINGGEVPTCKAMCDGVRYEDTNDAGKINMGLDVINAFSRMYDTTVPIFIDNAEGCNSYLRTESQTIRLYVTDDRQILIRHE